MRETEILVVQQPPQGVLVCDHAGLVINKFSLLSKTKARTSRNFAHPESAGGSINALVRLATRLRCRQGPVVVRHSRMDFGKRCLDNDLYRAVLEGDEAAVQKLLDKGADSHLMTHEGETLCDWGGNLVNLAAQKGHAGVVRILLDMGCDFNLQGRDDGGACCITLHSGGIVRWWRCCWTREQT